MLRKAVAALLCATMLAGCNTMAPVAPAASLIQDTKATPTLAGLPPPRKALDVAVYEFPDLTGQAKPNPSFAEYSRAVTQGAADILVDVLTTAGGGSWFHVAERNGLKDLVQERTLIENTRRAYQGNNTPLPPVKFAGLLLEGGIVGYDSDFITGGAGARFFGIGDSVQYRSDVVTVNLRAVSVSTGEVLSSVTTTKQIFSYENEISGYGYTAPLHLLELDGGMSHNDPGQFAVREAIELAVYSLIMNGLKSHLWQLADPALTPALLASFDANYEDPAHPSQVVDLPNPHPVKVAAAH
jgi:curli production assembly/transport component CsgG